MANEEKGPAASSGRSAERTGRLGRDRALDVLRGYAIVAMITSHVGGLTRLNVLLNFPMWLSAADGFVLVSGATSGISSAVGPTSLRTGLGAALRRAGRIYLVHCLITLGVVIVHELSGRLRAPSVSSFGGWPGALAGIATLRLQPDDYMNILPLFVVFLLLEPLALEACRRGRTLLLLVASATLWAFSQGHPSLIPLPRPSEDPVLFSLGAWQFAYMVGLTLGFHRTPIAGALERAPWAMRAVVALTVGLFLLAQAQRPMFHALHLSLPSSIGWLLAKPTWGPLHALYAALVVAAGYEVVRVTLSRGWLVHGWLGRVVDASATGLERIGRVSLRCFVLHLPFALFASAFDTWHWAFWAQEALTSASVVGVYLLSRWGRGRRSQPMARALA